MQALLHLGKGHYPLLLEGRLNTLRSLILFGQWTELRLRRMGGGCLLCLRLASAQHCHRGDTQISCCGKRKGRYGPETEPVGMLQFGQTDETEDVSRAAAWPSYHARSLCSRFTGTVCRPHILDATCPPGTVGANAFPLMEPNEHRGSAFRQPCARGRNPSHSAAPTVMSL